MNTNNTLETANDFTENAGSSASVDDFIRELAHLEEDLHITAELQIEVSESEFSDSNLPAFMLEEVKAAEAKPAQPEPPANPAVQEKLRREIANLESVIVKFKAERNDLLEHSRRQSEDFESFRNRTERERVERLSLQMKNLAVKMLPVLDNLDRAMEFARAMAAEKRAEMEQFLDGIALVHHQVGDVLAMMGVRPINSVGSEFDPELHEAIASVASETFPPNTVCEELLRGYQMGNQVVRHSMVKVTAPEAVTTDSQTPAQTLDQAE